MYCILALPRTASTSAWSYINTSLILHDARYKNHHVEHCEPFNPKYNLTQLQEQDLAKEFLTTDPTPVIKILTNQTYKPAFNFLGISQYKTVFIEPSDLKSNTLKTILMWKTSQYFGDRKVEREKLLGAVEVSQANLIYVLQGIKRHFLLKEMCDYKFTSNDIICNPNSSFLPVLGLPAINSKLFRHTKPYYEDYMLLKDSEKFDTDWDYAYKKVFGESV